MKLDRPDAFRIALLIDADNAPASRIEFILSELSTLGVADVRRAYGNWKKENLKPWEENLHEYAIRPIQQFDLAKKKNATDMAMVVDAMELLYIDKPDAFALVSSDADFTPLVMHLRSKGAFVYGFGESKTPQPFVNACSRFLYVDALTTPTESDVADSRPATPIKVPANELKMDTALISLLRNVIKAAGDEDGWARIGEVGQQIRNQSSKHFLSYGYASWTKLLKVIDLFELRDEGTSQVSVRDKRQAKSPKA
jgi:uncharacterized protein (TIGR00288 family)